MCVFSSGSSLKSDRHRLLGPAADCVSSAAAFRSAQGRSVWSRSHNELFSQKAAGRVFTQTERFVWLPWQPRLRCCCWRRKTWSRRRRRRRRCSRGRGSMFMKSRCEETPPALFPISPWGLQQRVNCEEAAVWPWRDSNRESRQSAESWTHVNTFIIHYVCVSTDSSSSNQTLFTFYTFYSSVHSSVTFQSMLLCLSVILRVFSFHTRVSRRQATSLKKICKLTGRFLSCDPEHILCTLITCCFIHESSLCWCIDRLTGCSTFVHIHRQTSNIQPSGPRVVTFTELPAASLCSVRFISRPFSRTATFPLSVHLNRSKQEKEKCEDLS